MTHSSPALAHRAASAAIEIDEPRLAPPPARHVSVRLGGFGSLASPPADPVPDAQRSRWYESAKHAAELCLSMILLVLTSPLVLFGAILVKLTSRGPAFYSQTRVGRYGKPFPIYKLRTMTHNCEAASGAVWSAAGDPRITAVGRLLRVTHIDELPQLWNVLAGQMSLIGPRPERPEFLPVLEQAVAGYRKRLQVRPGVTGLAQVQLPADTDIASVERKLAYDLYYVERSGLWLDARILLATFTKILGVSFPVARVMFVLPSWNEVQRGLASSYCPNLP
jgi:lipopolysaccharide/colanic/teichoic acid biosynthesis glycosyltransferase